MADKNKSKLIIGLGLIVLSYLFVAVILYFMGDANRKNNEKLATLQVQLTNLMSEQSSRELKPADASLTKREPINIDDFLAKAESIYGKAELDRKEGVLWVDRKGGQFMVSLGAVNGLKAGSRLGIYDGDNKIGDVIVQDPFDLVAYVNPVEKSIKDFEKNYYRAASKNNQK